MTSAVPNAQDLSQEIARVFALQRAHQWDVKATRAEQSKAKLARLKAAVEARADEIVAAVLEDTRKPEGEIRVTEVLNVLGNNYVLRDGTGVGVFAKQFGPPRGFFGGLKKIF